MTRLRAGGQSRRGVPRARRLAFLLLAPLLVAAAVLGPLTAQAKEFGPGDLRVCNAHRCTAITTPNVLAQLGDFYYGGAPQASVPAPHLGAIEYELRFRNGYVTGIVASARLDRFLSYGVNMNRFSGGRWYRLPAATARALRRLTMTLTPLRLTRSAEHRSR